ncbi:hypothetical protein VNI00_010466 [Paramarasmius palmivorus]|uniref:Protein kinase domain-containing protein n=1 Tax=Paramarasmius palmivorus TaxID=297713 RepID=A0AAW0CKP0_9AGAR
MELHRQLEHFADNNATFTYWSLIWRNSASGDFYYYIHPNQQLPENLSILESQARIIPKAYYRPKPPCGLVPALDSVSKGRGSYVKPYHPECVDDPERPFNDTSLADTMIEEAMVCERLADHPHPNIAEYYGYAKHDGYMVGLCFKQYEKSLDEAVKNGESVDVESILEGIRSGLEHMHLIGLVHCNVKPENVMLGSRSHAILSNFESCHRKGAKMVRRGSASKINAGTVATVDTDWHGFALIEEWLRGVQSS